MCNTFFKAVYTFQLLTINSQTICFFGVFQRGVKSMWHHFEWAFQASAQACSQGFGTDYGCAQGVLVGKVHIWEREQTNRLLRDHHESFLRKRQLSKARRHCSTFVTCHVVLAVRLKCRTIAPSTVLCASWSAPCPALTCDVAVRTWQSFFSFLHYWHFWATV